MKKGKLRFDEQIFIMLEINELDKFKKLLKRDVERLDNATIGEEIEEVIISLGNIMNDMLTNSIMVTVSNKIENILDLIHSIKRADITRKDLVDAIEKMYKDIDILIYIYEETLKSDSE